MTNEEYGQRLRDLRGELGLSLREVEERGGPSKDVLSPIERGLHKPRTQTLGRIAEAFGLSVAELRNTLEPDSPKLPELFSLVWARTASDAEFYRQVMTASEEDTDRLDKLSAELNRVVSRPIKRILAGRNNRTFNGPKPGHDERDHERMKERRDALHAVVNRRRPPFAVITWHEVGPAEVRWLVPEEQREALRPKIEETLKGEEYHEIGPEDPATTEHPPERSMALA